MISTNDRIKVMIVDDHPVFRYGLLSLLTQDRSIDVIGEAENAAAALTIIEKNRPEIVLLDIRMPGVGGINLAQKLNGQYPEIKVMILTAFEDEDYLTEAMATGVYAYLYKNSSSEILLNAIHLVHSGQKLLNPGQINIVLQKLQEQTLKQKIERYQLTEMELKILSSIAGGETYEEISQVFFLSEPTIKRMVAAILSKMGANNRAQAVAIAIRDGLI